MSFKIYKLTSEQTPKVYIGSTKLNLNTRFILHKTKFKNRVKYITANEILQYDDCKIELVEDCNCDLIDLKKKEGDYIRTLDCVNKNVAGRDLKQYYLDNVDNYRNRHLKFRNANPNYYNDYYHNNKCRYNVKIVCDCDGKYSIFTKSNHMKTKKHIKYLLSLNNIINH